MYNSTFVYLNILINIEWDNNLLQKNILKASFEISFSSVKIFIKDFFECLRVCKIKRAFIIICLRIKSLLSFNNLKIQIYMNG